MRARLGIAGQQPNAAGVFENNRAVISQLTGAIARAVLIVVLIATPSMLLPSIANDTIQVVSLVAIFGAALTFFEYSSNYPSLVEFRDAPPFNRVRYISLLLIVFFLSEIFRGRVEPTTLTMFVEAVGTLIGQAIDFPYSPVGLVVLMLPENTNTENLVIIRSAAGISYLVSLLTLVAFVLILRIKGWPTHGKPFNVWVNLPTFDPTAGSDVVKRLYRDARINIILGFLLPFISPVIVKTASMVFEPIALDSPQTMVWTMAAWAFLPASLFMRGIAMGRIASMIEEKRKSASDLANEEDHSLA